MKRLKSVRHTSLKGKQIDEYPASFRDLEACVPVYEELPGWKEDITHIRKFEDLHSMPKIM
ncbi:adenylosuccinate synthetase [Exiguobacterium antarcticum]|uniref:adenylosuccinate synthetase n=1 Tax=Exiguobacterium antarcticum TaxID=132920 RepID=UPI000B18C2AC